jgi:hypothetical protein
MNSICSIHQPTLFPWLGFFDKISKSDEFIFFDHIQRPQGKSYVSRVTVNCNGSEKWLTMPINKSGNSIQRIKDTTVNNLEQEYISLIKKLYNYYGKSFYKKDIISYLESFTIKSNKLSLFNKNFIIDLSNKLNLDTVFLNSSSSDKLMNSTKLGTEMIIETCKEFGIKRYLSGHGCLDFLVVDMFKQNDIDIIFQSLHNLEYQQINSKEFIKGMSILDVLFNIGFENTSKLIKNNK